MEVGFPTSWEDDIACYFDYDAIYEGLKLLFLDTYLTQEFFAKRVADLCLLSEKVQSVDVRVEKSSVYQECTGVGVSLSLRRPNN